jgi:hypothetical protein
VSNLDAIRQKLKELGEGKAKGFKRWKPKDEHDIRALPLGNGEEISFQIKWHYSVDAGRPMACPGTWGDDCVFCDLARSLKSWKDENGRDKPEHRRKQDWEFFKKVDAGIKHYIPMIERKSDGSVDGPFLWELTPNTFKAVLAICVDDDYNNEHKGGGGYAILTSITEGLDLHVSLKKAGEKGNTKTFDMTEIKERKRFSPVFKDTDGGEARARELLARIPTENDIAKPVSTAEAEKAFAKFKGSVSGDAPASNDAGTEYGGGNGNAEKPATGGLPVDDVVAKLEARLNSIGK